MQGTSIILPPPLQLGDLQARANPPQGSWDVYQDVLYDTVNFPQAGVGAGGQLKFFADSTHRDSPQFSNMQTQINAMQAGHLFHVIALRLDAMSVASANTAATPAGSVDDLAKVLFTTRGYLEFVNKRESRSRAPIPLHAIGGNPGITSAIGGSGAADVVELGTVAPGGFPLDMVLYPTAGFQINATFPVAIGSNLNAAAGLDLRLSLIGWHYVQR